MTHDGNTARSKMSTQFVLESLADILSIILSLVERWDCQNMVIRS